MQSQPSYEQKMAGVMRLSRAAQRKTPAERFCDVCDRPTTDWVTFTAYGIETTACEACRGEAV